MIELSNRKITRIQALLEFDVKRLKQALEAYEDDPIKQANNYNNYDKYELLPTTREGMEAQLKDSEENLKALTAEVDKATFVFGLQKSNQLPPKEEPKGMSIK
jgi:hypothetical protein